MQVDGLILTIAEHMPIGATRRSVCPFCNGGDKRETTFIVGREHDRVWYKCFRATCDSKPGVTGSATLPPARIAEYNRALERMRPYTQPTFPLEQDIDRDYFWHRFELHRPDAYVSEHDEYLLPVRGPRHELRGYVQRQPVWKGNPRCARLGRELDEQGKPMPKTKLYMHSTAPTLSWYIPPIHASSVNSRAERGVLVLVEDQVSAMKVAEAGFDAVALLGSSLGVEGVRDIARQRPSRVIVALDPGAEGSAQTLARKWGLYFERTHVVAMEADPKDTPADELARMFL
jgi:hypothetical protein